MKTYYEILEVDTAASPAEIKKAYRRLAMKWHPDRWETEHDKAIAGEQFKKVAQAYTVLSDAEQRATYDAHLEAELAGAESAHAGSERAHASGDSSRSSTSFEEAASSETANEMFFQQMLDFAVEMAEQGLTVEAIVRALATLGCPPVMAASIGKAVTRLHGTQSARGGESSSGSGTTTDTPRSGSGARSKAWKNPADVRSAGWNRVARYYAAYLSGLARPAFRSEDEFLDLQRYRNRFHRWTVAATLAWSVVTTFGWVAGVDGTSAIGAWLIGILISLIVLVVGDALVDHRNPGFAAERHLRKYLPVFRKIYERGGSGWPRIAWSAFFFGPIWAGYHRMARVGLFMFALISLLLFGVHALGLPEAVANVASWPAFILFAAIGMRLYFNNATQRIAAVSHLREYEAVDLLARAGGTSSLQAMAFVVLMICGVVLNGYFLLHQGASQAASLPMTGNGAHAEESPSDVASSRSSAPPASVSPTAAEEEFDRLLASYERRFPEINPESPKYDQRVVDAISQRIGELIDRGKPPDVALVQTVNEYQLFRAQQVAPGPPASPSRPVIPNSTRHDKAAETRSLQVLCSSNPRACAGY